LANTLKNRIDQARRKALGEATLGFLQPVPGRVWGGMRALARPDHGEDQPLEPGRFIMRKQSDQRPEPGATLRLSADTPSPALLPFSGRQSPQPGPEAVPMADSAICFMTAVELVRRLQAKELSARTAGCSVSVRGRPPCGYVHADSDMLRAGSSPCPVGSVAVLWRWHTPRFRPALARTLGALDDAVVLRPPGRIERDAHIEPQQPQC
jgi:hypothetical protein